MNETVGKEQMCVLYKQLVAEKYLCCLMLHSEMSNNGGDEHVDGLINTSSACSTPRICCEMLGTYIQYLMW